MRKLVFVAAIAIVFGGAWFFSPDKDTANAAVTPVGNWTDFASGAWLDAGDARYNGYGAPAGTTENTPFLIESAEEFAYLATLNNVAAQARFAGKYIKLSPKGCNYIDLSAHYWTPVKLYGGTSGALFEDNVSAHFDGDNVVIRGLYVKDFVRGDKIVFDNENYTNNDNWYDYENYNIGITSGGVAALFGEIYKVKLSNMRLDSPQIVIDKPSWFCSEEVIAADPSFASSVENMKPDFEITYGRPATSACEALQGTNGNTARIEVIGSLVGVARHSLTTNNYVVNPNIDINEYSQRQMVGGLIGYASGFNFLANGVVSGGSISLAPQFIDLNDYLAEKPDAYGYFKFQSAAIFNQPSYGMGYDVGGLVGANYHSAILNGFSDAKISYDESKIIDMFIRQDPKYNESGAGVNMYTWSYTGAPINIGGLVGWSNDSAGIAACILNSYSRSIISVDLTLDPQYFPRNNAIRMANIQGYRRNVLVGGIAGYVADAAVNNYFDGDILFDGVSLISQPDYGSGGIYEYNSDGICDSLDPNYGCVSVGRDVSNSSSANETLISGYTNYSHNSNDSYVSYNATYYLTYGKLYGGVNQLGTYCSNGDPSNPNYNPLCIDGVQLSRYVMDGNYYNSNGGLPSIGASKVDQEMGNSGWHYPQNPPYGYAPVIGGVTYDISRATYIADYTAPFNDNMALLSYLNGGLGEVATAIANDLSRYSNDPAIQNMLVAYGQSFISGWVMGAQGPVLDVFNKEFLPPCECRDETITSPIPSPPNTGNDSKTEAKRLLRN